MKRFFHFYAKGIMPTVLFMVVIGILVFLFGITAPVDGFLGLFVPKKLIFPGSGLLFVILFAPLILSLLAKGAPKKFFRNIVKRLPLLGLIWREEEIPSILEGAIPVAAKFSNTIIYGFLMGKSRVNDDTGFLPDKEVFCVFPPSVPIPFTSVLPMDFRPDDVREIEIVGREGRNQARMAIIRNKCFSLGQPLGKEIRYKRVSKPEIEKLAILRGDEKLRTAEKIKSEMEKSQSAE
jgi:hypothetical protein